MDASPKNRRGFFGSVEEDTPRIGSQKTNVSRKPVSSAHHGAPRQSPKERTGKLTTSELRKRIIENKRREPPVGHGRPPRHENHASERRTAHVDRGNRPAGKPATLHGAGGKRVSHADFQKRHKAGQFAHLTNGAVARRLKLDEQYRLYSHHGDVARRLELQKHAHPARHHGKVVHASHLGHRYGVHDRGHYHSRGRIHPSYAKTGIWSHYYGPRYFAPYCWFPKWRPWVAWSWHYRCDPVWDPRPYWCRPVVYEPCRAWVGWECPTWVSLPVVSCGTWVDVEPIVVDEGNQDLQLLAVRFVDPGHPEENLGPRYRVWFRNNSDEAIAQPFDVLVLAGNDTRMRAELPQAGVRVPSLGAGEIQSVDVRLPGEADTMNRDEQGRPSGATMLHVLVDASREVAETSEANNGVSLDRADILTVDPAAFEIKPSEAAGGTEVILAGEGLGPEPGRVLVHLGGLELEAEILGWYDLGVQWNLPELPLAGPIEAEVVVVRADGAATNPLTITVLPAEEPEVILAPPALPE